MQTNIKIMISILFWASIFIKCQRDKQIYLASGDQQNQIILSKLFSNISDGYYVDIGSNDPIFTSYTFNLHAKGWKGINVEPQIQKWRQFGFARPLQININLAISTQPDKMMKFNTKQKIIVSLADYKEAKENQYQRNQFSITLLQLCSRYYERKPTFMNINIGSQQWRILQGNDWKNQLCKPDLIFTSKIIQQNDIQKKSQQILLKNGYKKFVSKGDKNIYIHSIVQNVYLQKINQRQELKNKNIISMRNFLKSVNSLLNVSSIKQQTFFLVSKMFYLHNARQTQDLSIRKLNKYAKSLTSTPNKPIVVMNFNYYKSIIFVPYENYILSQIQVQQIKSYNLTILKQNNQKFFVYILDHFAKSQQKLSIVSLQSVIFNQELKINIQNMLDTKVWKKLQKLYGKEVFMKNQMQKNEIKLEKLFSNTSINQKLEKKLSFKQQKKKYIYKLQEKLKRNQQNLLVLHEKLKFNMNLSQNALIGFLIFTNLFFIILLIKYFSTKNISD